MTAPARESPLVLLVEDDAAIRETTGLLLEQFGFSVSTAADGREGLAHFREIAPDVALLDVMLPFIDGISLTRAIRDASTTPVVLLSARADPLDVVSGLEAGADDYVTKPFDGPVLVARLRAVLRRAAAHAAADAPSGLRFGELLVDPDGMSAEVAGVPVRLTATEARLLSELALNAGIVLSRQTLLERVWDYAWGGDTRLVDVHIQRLRAKLGADTIETVRGAGYKLRR